MFVKVCGITRVEDARAAVDAGVDAVGLNFSETSRRHVDVDTAAAIAAAVPDHVLTVGIFRDHLVREVLDIVGRVGLDAAQLHGDETAETSRAVHAEVPILIRAMSIDDPALPRVDEHGADVVLLDAPTPGGGLPFDWSLVGDLVDRHRLLLAGGLRPDTVGDAVAAVRPWGVDVASGVEVRPGIKGDDLVRAFVTAARAPGVASPHPPLTPAGTAP